MSTAGTSSVRPADRSASQRGLLRKLRLWTGQVLFLYALMHFLNHAFGIRSVEAMEQASKFLLDPWQSFPGQVLLYGSLLIHAGLGLRAFYRRRHLRIPVTEAVQLSLGLAIPLLLIAHGAGVRYAESVQDLDVDYARVIHTYWVADTVFGLPRQLLLLIVVWIHGCIGIRAWLRTKQWYARAVPALTAAATLIPVLAILGFINAGLDMRELAAANPALLPPNVIDVPGTAQAQKAAAVGRFVDGLTLAYALLLAGVVGLRAARDWHATRFRSVRITYPGGRVVTVPAGYSVLEASRWGGIPHASVCGGRGRCSTCRVDVMAGGETLPPAGPDEQRLLSRIGAPPSVRLACQIRPENDLAVVPLVHSATAAQRRGSPPGLPAGGRREAEVAALFVDLRQSTRLADDRLPYDTLFIVERYIKAVSAAVRLCGGHVTNIAGDGVMSVFGVEGPARDAARDAFRAALGIWDGIEALNGELHRELSEPLKVGIGLHVGVAVVGVHWTGAMEDMPFLGDTGNVAARLEAQTKRLDATLVASKEAVLLVADGPALPDFSAVMLPGKQEPVEAAAFRESDELRALVNVATPA
ncbi:adenylate/guanylate cyclase domain-containing protein [Mesorhizobium sp. LHD-90]|uniref:adenylate/guanylate cyclase domain-containing protein n=1 Tax=Mesorhizobium sp. LHD-90 TaxID=3071414 RepID=UPI0027DEB385|nr:adenylate/guanylate cyclase domain-containing protein [Mesorhizobium sp. LHD-90]MDQ6437264.1 adenylate/guanylate cyclase domain-containing protein [Mesorhizobium sp. LHD-90]